MNRHSQRLDAFPFQTRLSEVMSSPVITIAGDASVHEAARMMIEQGFSSLIVDAGERRYGIITERDILHRVASGDPVRQAPVEELASFPMITLPQDAFVYRALGRAARHGIRHLGVTDEAGWLVGVISARDLLRQRATGALMLGDAVAEADGPAAMKAVHDRLPVLARSLLDEGMEAQDIAPVLGQVISDLTARAIDLAEAEHPANALPRRCWLLLGASARGEGLLATGQRNALIWSDEASDAQVTALRNVARRVNELLALCGVPPCKAGVMAGKPGWQGSAADWQARLRGWAAGGDMPAEADLLLDAACMGGDRALCMGLQTILRDLVAGQSELLPRLAAPVQLHEAPLGRLGGLKPDAQGQIDLMCQGLWPIMAGARILTLCEGGDLATARATDARLLRLERLSHDQRQAFLAARRYLMTRLLICQLAQVERGDEPQNTVSLEVIARSHGEGLRKALKDAGAMAPLIRDCLRKRER